MHLQENSLLVFDIFYLGQGHTKRCPVLSTSCDYAPAKFEVAMANS